jgi:hypothetical protein
MTKTDYAENKVLDWCVGRSLAPISAYVALFTAAPSDTAPGTEVVGSGYTRKLTAPTDWTAAAAGSISNAVNLDFPSATSNYSAPVTHFGIMDAATGGNLLRWAALSAPRSFANTDTPRFAVGALVMTED